MFNLTKKTGILILFCLFMLFTAYASDSQQIADGTIGVTFATNSNIKDIRYYYDSGHISQIDSASRIEMSPGDVIYVTFNNSSNPYYDFQGFRIYMYDEKGIRTGDPVQINTTSMICLPYDSYYDEISIEPYGRFKERIISFSDSVDGNETNNEWMINENFYTGETSAAINSAVPYTVSFKYNPDSYYVESYTPDSRVISAGGGMVIFFEENPLSVARSGNLVEDYSVKLKPYTHFRFTDLGFRGEHRINRIVLADGNEIEVDELSEYGFKAGDSLTIETDRNWILTGDGAEIVQTNLTTESRVYSVTILNNMDYEINLSIAESNIYSVDFELDEIEEGEVTPDFQINFSDENYAVYDDIRKKNSVDIEAGETLYLSFINRVPSRERIMLTFVFADGHVEESGYIRDEKYKRNFIFSEEPETTLESVICEVEYGFYLPENISNDSVLDVSYYTDSGRQLFGGSFLPDGTSVDIRVRNCPSDKSILVSHNAKETESKTGTYEIMITPDTEASDFVVKTKQREGFYFDPSRYTYEHGTVEFKVEGVPVKSAKFLDNNTKIEYEAVSAESGFTMQSGSITVLGDFTDGELKEIKFVEDEPNTIVLNQAEFGGKIIYRYNGKELDESINEIRAIEGEIISYEMKPYNGYGIAGERTAEYKVSADKKQILPEMTYPFIEQNEHKTDIIFDIDGTPEGFIIVGEVENIISEEESDVKEIKVSTVKEERSDNISESKTFGVVGFTKYKLEDVGTHKPLVLKVTTGTLTNIHNQALKITREDTLQADNKQSEPVVEYESAANFNYSVSFQDAIETPYKEIELTFEVVDGYYHDVGSLKIENAEVSVLLGDRKIKDGDFVEADTKVEVVIIPLGGFYITGKDIDSDGSYRKVMKYSDFEDDKASIIANHPVIKYISLTLPESDQFGSYSYSYENKEIEPGKFTAFKDGTKLKVEFTANEKYRIDNFLSKPSATKNILIESDMDNTTLNFRDLGIKLKEAQE